MSPSRRLRDGAERALFARGIWIRNPDESRHRSLERFDLPDRIARQRDSSDPYRFVVPTERITTPYGFSFGGWHPYTETLAQAERTNDFSYDRSLLHRFHARFQPRSLADATLVRPDAPEVRSLADLPHSWEVLRDIWFLPRRKLTMRPTGDRIDDGLLRSPHVGPMPDGMARSTHARLIETYESILDHGYDPDRFDGARKSSFDGYAADGYFLWHRGSYRFVVLHGHHRIGAARHLGVEEVRVRIRRRYVPVVQEPDLERFHITSIVGVDAMQRVFLDLVSTDGWEKARRWGLIEGASGS